MEAGRQLTGLRNWAAQHLLDRKGRRVAPGPQGRRIQSLTLVKSTHFFPAELLLL